MSNVVDNDLPRYDRLVSVSSRVTIRDVAAQAGVSVATVSKVINERYGVAAATVSKVRAVIDDLGYEASLVAQSLRNQRTNVIGVLVADIEPFSAELLKGAADAIRGSGYDLMVYSAGGRASEQVGWESRYLSRLSGTLLDGAVLVTPTVTEADMRHSTPIVAVDPHTGPAGLPSVAADSLRGAQAMTEYLIGLGHQRIGMVSGRPDLQSAQLREAGYRRALAAAGLPADPEIITVGAYDSELARVSARHLLTSRNRPTAIFCANDISALAVMAIAQELGLRVPEDISIAGFDNIPESALGTPPLTTVEQPIRDMGRRSVEMLIALIAGQELSERTVTLSTALMIRGSTGTPPAH